MIDKNEFQKAFSVLHASGDTLQEVLNMTAKRKQPGRRVHILIAAAAVLCLLVTTALAAPILYKQISGSVTESWEAATPTDDQGSSVTGTVHMIRLDIPLNETAPDEIETYYLPQVPAEYPQSFGYAYGGLNFDRLYGITLAWDVPGGEKKGIMFYQTSAYAYQVDGVGFSVFSESGQEPVMKTVTLGGVEGFLIEEPDEFEGRQYFCWTDGDYVLYMRFPYSFTEEQMSEIIASVQPVEDIRPWLISMTDEELAKTFADRFPAE